MLLCEVVIFCTLLSVVWGVPPLVFPPGFRFGSASSAYQVEGAWNVSDKSESIWDRVMHTIPWMSYDGTNGDVACDSYHQWQRDVEMVAELGLDFYRFSISWPRLVPNGIANKISEDGKNYYNNLINALLDRGIEPLVTIYHWDLPQSLQDLGGWTNPLIVNWFEDYARVVFSLFGDRVKTWITINEPTSICDTAYSVATFAPSIVDLDMVYSCSRHVLLAHAKAWRIYDTEFKPLYNGKVSICNHWIWYEPATEADQDAAELSLQYIAGRYTHPIYSKEGGWPPALEERINAYGVQMGFTEPRMPPFTEEEKELIRGTYDYYAFNHYCGFLARHAKPGEKVKPHYVDGIIDLNVVMEIHPTWPPTFVPIFNHNTPALRKHMAWIRQKYGDMEFIIAENGHPTAGDMHDYERMKFIHDNLEQVWFSIYEDGANITGYSYWSLMDSFEWNETRLKFGLYQVDFSSPERTRTPRASAEYYKTLIKYNLAHQPQSVV